MISAISPLKPCWRLGAAVYPPMIVVPLVLMAATLVSAAAAKRPLIHADSPSVVEPFNTNAVMAAVLVDACCCQRR